MEAVQELTGRRDELALLARFFDSLGDGPRALVLEGEAGIGKTALWLSCQASARSHFYWLLSSRAVEGELKLPFTVVGDLLDRVAGDVLPQLPGVQRSALESALLLTDTKAPTDSRAVGAAVLNVIRQLAEVAPVVIAIDDVQWVDPASARTLTYALRRLQAEAVGVLVTLRKGSPVPALRVDELFPVVRRFEVGPLGFDDLDRVVRERLHVELSRPTLRKIYGVSGGNPLYALELARHVESADGSLRVPGSLRALLEQRIARLPVRTKRALLAVAASSDRRTETILDALAATERVFTPAVDAGLVAIRDATVQFTHPLLGSVIHDDATPAQRRKIHRSLAAVVRDPDVRARHLALAAEEPDAEVAANLDAAAARARARGAPDEAAELFALARRLTPSGRDGERRRRIVDEARSTFDSGDARRARRLLEDVIAAAPPGRFRAAAARELGRMHYYHDNHHDAVAQLRQARAEAGDDVQLAAMIDRDLAYALGTIGDYAAVARCVRRARTLALAAGDPLLVAEAEAIVAVTTMFDGRPPNLRALRRAAELDDRVVGRPIEMSPTLVYGIALNIADRTDQSRAVLLGLRDRMLEQGAEGPVAWTLFQLAETEANAGRPYEALSFAEAAIGFARQAGLKATLAPALYARTLALALLGRVDEAHASGAESLAQAEQSGWRMGSIRTHSALGLLELSRGNSGDAVRELSVLTEPGVIPFFKAWRLADLVEAMTRCGSLDQAEDSLADLERIAIRSRQTTPAAAARRCRALLALARGDARTAERLASESVERFEHISSPIELGRSLIVQGGAQRRSKQRAKARQTLERALALLEEAGAALFAERARGELRRVGGRRSTGDLTAAESRVAQLAAEGRRNREIAVELYVTEKTVEAALSRSYRKLGIRSRSELTAALAARERSIKL